MSIFQKTFVFLHHLCTSGAKSAKKQLCSRAMQDKKTRNKMKILHTLRLDRMKWRHWVLLLLLILVTLTKMIPLWGVIYTYRVYPVIGSLLSPISGIFPFAVGDIFIALSIAWVVLYPIYEMGLRKKLAHRFIFLAAKSGGYPKKKAGVSQKKRRFRGGN